jgi:hypothetical protein
MNFGRGLRFPFADPNWVAKVVIGTLVSLVPFLNFVATGYMLDVIRNVVAGRETPLPEWNNFGDKFVRGLLSAVITFLWQLPLFVLVCPLYVVALASGADPSSSAEPSTVASIALLCLGLLVLVASLVLVPITFVAISRYAVTNNFSAALPGPVFQQLRSNLGSWIMILVALVGVGLVAGLLAVCTFGIGAFLIIPFVFYLQLVQGHWLAQAYRLSAGNQPLPPSMV